MNMKPGDWYKQFGSEEKQHDTYEIYYHVIDINGDVLLLDEYGFYTHFKRLVKRNKKPIAYNVKQWLEENISNNVYEVEKENLPFYLSI
jgi:hypothetical protein